VTNVEADIKERLTFGEALADRVAKFGGSWTFIILFAGIMIMTPLQAAQAPRAAASSGF
jgi:uncharacterized membrane protein